MLFLQDAKIHFLINCEVPLIAHSPTLISFFYISPVYLLCDSKKAVSKMLVNKPEETLYLSLVKDDFSLATHMHWLMNLLPEKKNLELEYSCF